MEASLPAAKPATSPIEGRSNPKLERVTGKVRAAIEAMVWEGLPRAKAAEKAGISEHGLYKALRKPPVKAAYLAELDVLRTSERARNIHRLTQIRDAADNMPAVNAIKMLEQIPDDGAAGRGNGLPTGLTVVVVNAPQPAASAAFPTDARNVIEHDQ